MDTQPSDSAERFRSTPGRQFSEDERRAAATNIVRAFELAGLLEPDGRIICPTCLRPRNKTDMRFYDDGGFKCFGRNAGCGGPYKMRDGQRKRTSAVGLLLQYGWDYDTAVVALAGLGPYEVPASAKREALPEGSLDAVAKKFIATVDVEVFEYLLAKCEPAYRHYERFHIAREAVDTLRFRQAIRPYELQDDLIRTFGAERLDACGLRNPERETFMFGAAYPIIEPHLNARGEPVYLQFRASVQQERRIKTGKEALRRYREYAAQVTAAGGTPRPPRRYEEEPPKFLSMRGGVSCGIGVPKLAELDTAKQSSKIWIAEGGKDAASLLTFGQTPYGLPGNSAVVPDDVLRMLLRHNILLAFDADDGGRTGQEKFLHALVQRGALMEGQTLPADADDLAKRVAAVRAKRQLRVETRVPPVAGMDATDVLVAKHTEQPVPGCPACEKLRKQPAKSGNRR